jgi:DNA modification methylase
VKPFYQHNGTTIYCDDCLDVLSGLDPGSVDLVVTSPPFNANMEYEVGMWETLDDYRMWLCERFAALWGICASGAWVTIELQDLHVSPEHSHAHPGQKEQFNMATSSYLTVAMIERGFYFKGEAIWNRGRWTNNMAGMACAPGSPALLVQHSKVLFFRKPGGRKGVYQFPEQTSEWKATWCRTVWDHVQPEHCAWHPAVMPFDMARGLIQGWSLPNSTILDLFMGSGTVLRAAKNLGRKVIGIDIDEGYCGRAVHRLAQETFLPVIEDMAAFGE